MKSRIFLFGENQEELTAMDETPYAQEDILQHWLASYCDLLPGDQIDPERPRRWLLVSREMPVPDSAALSSRWSLDHLFLDQDGIPTFVECKRSSDPRARREVVAQMLDYAANAVQYWKIQQIRDAASRTAQQSGRQLDDCILSLIGPDGAASVEEFWSKVEENLTLGKVRLIFVTDESRQELRRLVEFLNEKLTDVEVLLVEIRQFVGQGRTAVVPRVIGATEAARIIKRRPARQPWTDQTFLEKLRTAGRVAEVEIELVERIFDWARRNGLELVGGTGASYGTVWLALTVDRGTFKAFYVYEGQGSSPVFHFQLYDIETVLGSQQGELLRERLRGLRLEVTRDARYPGLSLSELRNADLEQEFFRTLDWLLASLRQTRSPQ